MSPLAGFSVVLFSSLPCLLSEFSLSFHLLHIFCFSPAPSFFPLLSFLPLPWAFQVSLSRKPRSCPLGPTVPVAGPDRLLLCGVSALQGPGADLLSSGSPHPTEDSLGRLGCGFSQYQVQGCCGSGQLLPEPPCPPPECRVIGKPVRAGASLAWCHPSFPGWCVVVPVLLGAGLASPPTSCCGSLMNSTTLYLGHGEHKDASNQVLSVRLALACALGSAVCRAQQTPAPSPPVRPALGWAPRLGTQS